MHRTGILDPEDPTEAREQFAESGPTAQVVVREVARAMAFDREEYRDRVTGDVVETARESLFASLLAVTVGTREEFETWCESFDGEVSVIGSENVDGVVWHAFDGRAVAATFHEEEDAAVGTLRRQAFGDLYRDVVYDE